MHIYFFSFQNSNRLITLHLLRDVEVCVLCSNEPALAVLEEEVIPPPLKFMYNKITMFISESDTILILNY